MLAEPESAGGVLLLDWNESPFGAPSAAVDRVIANIGNLHRYPRGLMEEVTTLAAAYLGVRPSQVLLTSGVDEAIDIALSLAKRAWGIQPGFDGYELRVEANDKPFHPIPLGPDWQPTLGWDQMTDGDIVFLAQPGNPTGNLIDWNWVRGVRSAAEYVFIDETYREFASCDSVLDGAGADDPGLLVYRSFAKAFGLAGIRVGCLIGQPDVIERLEPYRRFMPIDAVSLHAAAGLLVDPNYVRNLAAHVRNARPALASAMRDSSVFAEVRDTEANFVLARLRPDNADRLRTALAADGIQVKVCDALGLAGWIRVSVGTWDDQKRFADCLARVDATDAAPVGAGRVR